MNAGSLKACTLAAVFVCWSTAAGQSLDVRGEMSGWIATESGSTARAGLRFIPALGLAADLGAGMLMDLELAAQATTNHAVQLNRDSDARAQIKAYRAWARLASPQFELRAGLQHISFGSATLLRPLMWFDRIDPRDPTQNTVGVWGLLGRHYFLGNANIWLWALYGNRDPKGLEGTPTARREPEAGGRVQVPLSAGEIGLSYHRRSADWSGVPRAGTLFSDRIEEQRLALDGKWDIGIGIWFEGSYQRSQVPEARLRSNTLATLGADYTFGVGNGLHVLGEYLHGVTGERFLGRGTTTSIAASSFNYPLGVLDNITAMIYSDVRHGLWYRFALWQRRTDAWTFNVLAYWNPEEMSLVSVQGGHGTYGGRGVQVMVVFNY